MGVDGCRAGWFTARLDGTGGFDGFVYPSVASLFDANPTVHGVLIDVPIGLVSNRGGRACDREARKILGGGRASSVFTAPARAATRVADYIQGSRLNEEITGKRLSKQAWGIVPKIAQVDSFILSGGLRDRNKLREVHPEVLFWALNDCSPMQFRKSTAEGIEESKGSPCPVVTARIGPWSECCVGVSR